MDTISITAVHWETTYVVEGACDYTILVLGKESSDGGILEIRGRVPPSGGVPRLAHAEQAQHGEQEQSWTGAHNVRLIWDMLAVRVYLH